VVFELKKSQSSL